MVDTVLSINDFLNSIVWGPVMLAILLCTGIAFSIGTNFFQFRHVKLWFSSTLGNILHKKDKKDGVSSFEAMTAALSGCMGTGNIVGVATAIVIGGAGAVFWMWVSAIFGMMTAFAENVLGIKYRQKNAKGENVGGPMYYMEHGLKCKPLAIIFSVCCMLASFGIGNMSQVNSMTEAFEGVFNVPTMVSSIVICVLVGIIILGGIKRLVGVTSKLVPFMTIFYVVMGLIVIMAHFSNLGNVFLEIFKGAFGIQSALGGISGYALMVAMRSGISRGVFSNEAGMGSSSIAHSCSSAKNPVEQGMWGIFQVFTDTIIGCSITALCILSTGALSSGENGIDLTCVAFSSVFGSFGNIIITVAITLFAFSTLVTWSYYGEKSVEYLFGNKCVNIYKVIFCGIIILGGNIKLELAWGISDTLNGFMAMPNLIALIFLFPKVIRETKNYLTQIKSKKEFTNA